MKTIFHYGGWGRNYGDFAIQKSMVHNFNKNSNQPLEFVPIDLKVRQSLNREIVEYMNITGDLLIVGGGGLFMQGDIGVNTLSGWQFNISKEDLSYLKIPLVIYGAGYNYFPYDNQKIDTKTLEHIKLTRMKSHFFSVRDRGSKNVLLNLGIKNIDVIPDPGIFCPSADINFTLPNIYEDDYLIGLNWAGDRPKTRFKFDEDYVLKNFISELKTFCIYQSDKLKRRVKIIFIPHVFDYDIKRSYFFKKNLGDFFYDCSKQLPWLYPERSWMVPFIVSIYGLCDITIGMRGHSNLISFGAGVPFLAIGDHPKNRFFSDEVNGETIGDDFRGLFSSLVELSGKDYTDHSEKFLTKFKIFENYNKRILSIIGATNE